MRIDQIASTSPVSTAVSAFMILRIFLTFGKLLIRSPADPEKDAWPIPKMMNDGQIIARCEDVLVDDRGYIYIRQTPMVDYLYSAVWFRNHI